MSILTQILENDIVNCRELIENDAEIKEVNKEIYALLGGLEQELAFSIEDKINQYGTKMTRLAYVQGMHDIVSLYDELKRPPVEIVMELEE